MPAIPLPSLQRIIRPGIRVKLFLAIVAVCAAMAVSMSVATRLSFQSGFFEYLTEIEEDRVSALADELAEDYKQQKNWKALSDSRNWRRKIIRFSRDSAQAQAQTDADQKQLPQPPAEQNTKNRRNAGQKEERSLQTAPSKTRGYSVRRRTRPP